jgi:SAM-dependent methyltransferase
MKLYTGFETEAPMNQPFDIEAFRTLERQGHDRLAGTYAGMFAPITGRAVPYLLDAAHVCAGSRILDVACGPGLVCRSAHGLGATPVGIDISTGMVAKAIELHPRIEFRVGDVEALPFADRSFDAVVSNFGLGHFPRAEKSVAECVRVLKPGGFLAFAWWDTLEKQRLQAVFREALFASGVKPSNSIPTSHDVYRYSNTEAFRGLLEGAGLKGVAIELYQSSLEVADADLLWQTGMGSLVVTSSIILGVSDEDRVRIRAAFQIIAETYRAGSFLVIPLAFKIGSGHKAG